LKVALPVPLQNDIVPAACIGIECNRADGVLRAIGKPFDFFAGDDSQMVAGREEPVEPPTTDGFERQSLLAFL
jgi:hypothetical protein